MFKILQNLLNSDIKLIIKKVVNLYETCIKFRKPSPQTIVAFLKADDFNETVSLHLHQLQPGLWYMCMIDEFTKFSATAVITSKSHSANIFIKYWIVIFGAPKKIFSENGRKFTGETFIKCVNDSILKYKQLQHSVLGVMVFAKDTIRLWQQFYWKQKMILSVTLRLL